MMIDPSHWNVFRNYVYVPRPITPARRADIVHVAHSMSKAAVTFESSRVTYEALMDLLNVASQAVCDEAAELQR